MDENLNNNSNDNVQNETTSNGFYNEFNQEESTNFYNNLGNENVDNTPKEQNVFINNNPVTNNIENKPPVQNTFINNNSFITNANNVNNTISYDSNKEDEKKKKRNNRRKVIFAILFALLILVIGGVFTVMILSEMKIIKLPWLEYPEVVNLSQNEVMLKRKSNFQFSTNVYPSQVHYGRIIYESSNPDIASINPITGYVDAKSNGITTIKAYLEDYKDIYDTCEVVVSNNHVKVQSISVDDENVDLMVGNKYLLKYSYSPSNAGVHYFSYLSSDKSILSVDNKGEVTGVRAGKAMVTILDEASGNQTTQEFTIHDIVERTDNQNENSISDVDETVNIDNIKISTTEVNLVVNGEQQIAAEVLPIEANQKLTWKSINPTVATVNQDGLIKGIEVGNTEIIVTAVNGMNKVISVTVQTNYVDIDSMVINSKDLSINVGSSKTIGVTIKPKNATNQKIIWLSSDSNIATVNQSGKITGVNPGKVTITAKTLEDEITSSIVVTVNKVSNFVNETDLTISNDNVTIDVGGTSYIKANVLPSNATNKKVTWKSSNESVATVKDGMITGKGAGSTIITVKTNNKGITKTINVNVRTVEVTGITLSETSTKIGKGGEISLYATVLPNNATNKKVTWSSSNTSVAKVNSNGLVETLSLGTTIITATTNNGIKASCTITVTNESIPVNSITLSNSKVQVKVNGEGSLTPVITPSTATNQRVSWTINNTNIATVSEDGTITGKKEGIVIITAKTNNGKSASASVIVKNNGASVNYLDGSTIKYWVDNSYGNYAISHIWVKDPYNQIKTEMPDKLGNLATPNTLLKKAASKNSGKTLIGINASGFTNASFTPKLYNQNHDWKNTSLSPVIYYEGKLIRDFSNYEISSGIKTYSIDKNGNLVHYSYSANSDIVNKMEDDGIKYTFSFFPILVKNGEAQNYLDTKNNIRQYVCQIDKNNFLFITSTISTNSRSSKGLNHRNMSSKMVQYGCKTAYALDGGGSASLYYVKKGSTTPTKIKVHEGTYGRAVPDVLYFVGE